MKQMTTDIEPNLFVVGAAKAGTTALCAGLAQHPEIFFPAEKEPHFHIFDPSGSRCGLTFGVSTVGRPIEYSRFVRRHTDYLALFREGGSLKFRGDGSTQYFVSDKAAKNIFERNPESKILIQLREPVSRAWSAYSYALSRGEETASFADALREEVDGIRANRFYGGYLATSNYGAHVNRWVNLFGKDNVYVSFAEQFRLNPQENFNQIFDFLGLERYKIKEQKLLDGNPTIFIQNPALKIIRNFGRSVHSRYAWVANIPGAKKFQHWLLSKGACQIKGPSPDETDFFQSLLLEAAKTAPLASVIGNHPYQGV